MPITVPVIRVMLSIPEVIPSLSWGTAPRMALLFGEWKMPIPRPTIRPTTKMARAVVAPSSTHAAMT